MDLDLCRTCMRQTAAEFSLFDAIMRPATEILIASAALKVGSRDENFVYALKLYAI